MTGVAIAFNADLGSPAYAAGAWRQAAAVVLQYDGRAMGGRQGVRPGGDQLKVSLAGSTITVQPGLAVVDPALTTVQGPYWVAIPTAETHTLNPANATNPRKDIVILQVRDNDEDLSGFKDAATVYLPGVASPTPVEAGAPAGAIKLALIDVPAQGGGSAVVTDRRVPHLAGPEMVKFTSSGSFTIVSYPWARRLRVRLVGGGGAGGGVEATGAGQVAEGGGGGGGGYADRWLDVWQLAASETVTVGAGGVGVSGAPGGSGGTSSFGSWVSATGGGGGNSSVASSGDVNNAGGAPGTGSTGDLFISGERGHEGTIRAGVTLFHNEGGSSHLGAGAAVAHSFSTDGNQGQNYGGGASGARQQASSAARPGANGAAGIVIVELY